MQSIIIYTSRPSYIKCHIPVAMLYCSCSNYIVSVLTCITMVLLFESVMN